MENKLTFTRVFDAPRNLVFKAWTTPEIIKKWWGPEGFTTPYVKIDFKVGGKYTFAMHGPVGSEWDRDMYSSGVFKEIIPNEKIVTTDYFSDKDGNIIEPSSEGQDSKFPKEMGVTILFEDAENGKTKLSVMYDKPQSEEEFQAMIKSGMEEGWQSTLNKLEKALKE